MFKHLAKTPVKVWFLTIGHFVVDFPAGAFFIALPYFKTKFGLDYEELALAPMFFNLVGALAQPIFGYYSDKTRFALRMSLGCLFSSFGLSMCLIAPTYPLVLAATVVSSLGSAIFHPEASKCANLYSTDDNKGKGFSTFVVGGYIGAACGSFLMGILLSETWAWEWLFILPALFLFKPLYDSAKKMPSTVRTSTRKLIKRSVMIPLVLILSVLFVRSFITSGISTFVPLYLIAVNGVNEHFAGTVLALMMAGSVVGTYLGGVCNDKYGYRIVLLWSLLPVMLTLFLFQHLSVYWASFFIAANSIFIAVSWTSLMLLAQKLMPGNLATASALTQGFALGMGAIGVTLLGKIADSYDVSAVFTFIMFLPLIAFILSIFIKENEQEQPVIIDA